MDNFDLLLAKELGGGGGGGSSSPYWKRPTEFPDLDKINLANDEVVYLSYKTDTPNSYAVFGITATGDYTVDIGTIENGAYTVKTTETFTSSGTYMHDLTGYAEEDYLVLRVRGNISVFDIFSKYYTNGGANKWGCAQSLVEIYGRLPHLTTLESFVRDTGYVESVKLVDMGSVTSMMRVGAGSKALVNVDISGVTNTVSLYLAFQGARALEYLYLHGVKSDNLQQVMDGTLVEYTDCEGWSVTYNGSMLGSFSGIEVTSLDLSKWNITATNCNNLFSGAKHLEKLNISTWTLSGSGVSMFQYTDLKEIPSSNYTGITDVTNMFYQSTLSGNVTMPKTTATDLKSALQYCSYARSITIPNTYTSISTAGAFRNASNCEEIHFEATTPPTLTNSNAFTTSMNSNLKIYVPSASLNTYKTATQWVNIAGIIYGE